MKVVLVNMQAEKLRDNIGNCPLGSKNLCKLFDVVDSSFSYWENAVAQPSNTDGIQFLNKESLSKLSCQSWELLNNWMLYSPILILRELC